MVIDVDLENHTYTVTVTPEGGVPTLIARDYAFRSEQSGVGSLNKRAYISFGGSHVISNISFQSEAISGNIWQSIPFGNLPPNSVVGFQVKPISGSLVIGLSDGAADQTSDLGCDAQFLNTSIEAIGGGSYSSENTLAYANGSQYRVVIYPDQANRKYMMQVVSPNDQVSLVALNYDFRSGYPSGGSFDNLSFISTSGSSEVSDVRVDLASDRALFFPTPPTGFAPKEEDPPEGG